ncbi:ABC transporter permease [Gammaproteobacteria bacterium]|nr:ABC transporter permease [Gammaproteobacteria bacterium]
MNHPYIVAFNTIFVKEILRFTRIWAQTLLPPAISTALYFIIFGKLIGARIGEMGGFSYPQYIAPGLIMMSIITNSYANVVSSFYGAKYSKHIEELLVSPVPNYLIITGFVAGGVARGFAVGLIVTGVSMCFTNLPLTNLSLTLLVFLLTSITFSLAGFINAAYGKTFDDISIIPTFVLTPLTYLGGVFYSVSLLSEFWQSVSHINPILYMVNAFRYGMLGVSDINIYAALSMLTVLVIILFSFALYVMHKGIGIKS